MPRKPSPPPPPSDHPADGAAGEPPSLDALARRYMDLWQDQWAAVAADPDMTSTFARLVRTLGQAAWPPGNPFTTAQNGAPGGAGAWMAGAPFLSPSSFPWGSHAGTHTTTAATAATTGATPAGDASDGGDGRLAEFAERIALLERQARRSGAKSWNQGGANCRPTSPAPTLMPWPRRLTGKPGADSTPS
ncbi:MAG: hypothetical protein PW843_18230 [Azospirillaceae bacterium]|nr:hypothetical protein [Azospirillaceae bacterium]